MKHLKDYIIEQVELQDEVTTEVAEGLGEMLVKGWNWLIGKDSKTDSTYDETSTDYNEKDKVDYLKDKIDTAEYETKEIPSGNLDATIKPFKEAAQFASKNKDVPCKWFAVAIKTDKVQEPAMVMATTQKGDEGNTYTEILSCDMTNFYKANYGENILKHFEEAWKKQDSKSKYVAANVANMKPDMVSIFKKAGFKPSKDGINDNLYIVTL